MVGSYKMKLSISICQMTGGKIMIMLYKMMELLGKEKICRRMEEKAQRKADEKAEMIPKDKRCEDCFYGHFHRDSCILASGYECRLNPLKPISLGIIGAKHEYRERAIEETEMIKRAYMSSNGKVLQISDEQQEMLRILKDT